jgi:hypothetical protein
MCYTCLQRVWVLRYSYYLCKLEGALVGMLNTALRGSTVNHTRPLLHKARHDRERHEKTADTNRVNSFEALYATVQGRMLPVV